jgi:xylulokinase
MAARLTRAHKKRGTALYLGIDLGTSSLKALVSDDQGSPVASATSAYPLARPRPGWAEQDPEHWWVALVSTMRALEAGGVALRDIAALGLAGQMHGLVLVDGLGAALGPCHTWADARCAREVHLIQRRVPRERLVHVAGSRANTSATAAKLLWVQRHEPDRWRAAHAALLPKDYLRGRLVGALATDPSDASGTLLCDLSARDWSDDLLAALDLPRALLPPIAESPSIAGSLMAEAAAALGLRAGIPVAMGGGDAECAALGLGIVGRTDEEGLALATLGTGGQCFVATPRPLTDPQGRIQALCHAAPGRWHLMGAILSGASALDWLAASVGAPSVETLLDEAATEPPGAHGLLFLPSLQGARMPDMDPLARGAFVGLRPEHGRGALARAAVEGVALALREGLVIARTLGVPVHRVRLAGGANRHPLWRRVQADVFGVPVEVSHADEASAMGAAVLALVCAGAAPSVEAAARLLLPPATVLEPDPEAAVVYERLFPVWQEIRPSLRRTAHALARLHLSDRHATVLY